MKRLLTLGLMVMLISACGGGSKENTNDGITTPVTPGGNTPEVEAPEVEVPEVDEPVVEDFTLESKNLSSLRLLDASGNPLGNAEVLLNRELAAASVSMQAVPAVLITDADGNIVVDDLTPGTYNLTVTIGGISISMTLVVSETNGTEGATAVVPVQISIDGNGVVTAVDLTSDGIVISVSGVIYDATGPVAEAQVSVSGGAGTNGTVASAVTDENGVYTLVINVGDERVEALQNGTIRISAAGYQTRVIDVVSAVESLTNGGIAGLNFKLSVLDSDAQVYYSEDFEQTAAGAVCGNWTEMLVENDYFGCEAECIPGGEIPVAASSVSAQLVSEQAVADPRLLWNSHGVGETIYNRAYLDGLVVLAPNDTSGGLVVSPQSNAACWYGDDETGTQGTGNFLGDFDSEFNTSDSLNGGQSLSANGAAIVSPQIDLTGLEAPVSLAFDTWWEIESVNPNENGFDIMAIEYTTDNGDSWQTLARLNPFTDPVGSDEDSRAPIPFSNTGFNSAPQWLQQEPISLDALIGDVVQLRFAFRTQDGLYNGFRGWMVDNIKVLAVEGTFPEYIEPDFPPIDTSEVPDFSMAVEFSPSFTFLNEGSESTLIAAVDWVGTGVYSIELNLRDDAEQLLESDSAFAEEFSYGEVSYYQNLSVTYAGNAGESVYLEVIAKDSVGNVLFTDQKVYNFSAI